MMREIEIGNKIIGPNQPLFFIAEAGINHDGDFEKAKRLIIEAKAAGADAIKFQSFKTETLWNRKAVLNMFGEQKGKEIIEIFDMTQLSKENFFNLKLLADEIGIIFLSTPFDKDFVDFLIEINVPAFKVASSDMTYHSFLEYIAGKRIPVILSTGMSSIEEIDNAIEIFKDCHNENIILLQCISSYPSREEEMNLLVMREFEEKYFVPSGLSDHTVGDFVPIIAASCGARVIEKHFTLNCIDRGPDHKLSLDPIMLRELIQKIRRVERILGKNKKKIIESEKTTRKIGKRSLFAARDIEENVPISSNDIVCQRPDIGIPAEMEKKIYNRCSKKKIFKDSPIYFGDLEE
jgi:N,N'-diacetyllegionaminate synthase